MSREGPRGAGAAAGRGRRARGRSGPRSAPAGRAARQLPAVGGAEQRRRGEGTGGGGRRGRRRGGAGPLVSTAPLLSPPGEEEEERGQPPPPSQPRPAHLNSPRHPGPRAAPRAPGARPARSAASVPRRGASPGPPPALPRLAWPRLCVRRPRLSGSSGCGRGAPPAPSSARSPPGNPGRAPPTVDLAASRRRAPAPASPSPGPRPRARLRHGCEVLPRGGRGPRRPGLRAVSGVLRLQQGDRAGAGAGGRRGGGHLPISGAPRAPAPRPLHFSLPSPLLCLLRLRLCPTLSLYSFCPLPTPPFCPSAGAPLSLPPPPNPADSPLLPQRSEEQPKD